MKQYKRIVQYMPVGNLEPMQTTESTITLEDVIKIKGFAEADPHGCIKYCRDHLFVKYNGHGCYRNYITVM